MNLATVPPCRIRDLTHLHRGQLRSIEARLADTIIKAPFAGVVGLRNVSIGSFVSPGDVITTLDDISPIKGDFTVRERLLGMLKPGLAIEAGVAAYPGETFAGTVSSVESLNGQIQLHLATGQVVPVADVLSVRSAS